MSEEEKKEPAQEETGPRKIGFSEFILMLSGQTMIQMGLVPNPQTGKTEVDYLGAQATIECIAMLQEKTEGNLTEDEGKLITNALYDLRMRYVDMVRKAQPKDVTEEEPKEENETKKS